MAAEPVAPLRPDHVCVNGRWLRLPPADALTWSAEETAAVLRKPVRTVQLMLARGQLQGDRTSGRWMVYAHQVENKYGAAAVVAAGPDRRDEAIRQLRRLAVEMLRLCEEAGV